MRRTTVERTITLYREVIAGRARGQVPVARAEGEQPVRRHARAAGGAGLGGLIRKREQG